MRPGLRAPAITALVCMALIGMMELIASIVY